MSQRDDAVYIEHMQECISRIRRVHVKRAGTFFRLKTGTGCGIEEFTDAGRIQSTLVNREKGTFPVDTLERYIWISQYSGA